MSIKYDKILGKIREYDGSGSSSSSLTASSGITISDNAISTKIDNQTIKYSGDTTMYVETQEFWQSVPLTSGSTGTAGDFAYNSSYLFICVDTNQWKRIPYGSW